MLQYLSSLLLVFYLSQNNLEPFKKTISPVLYVSINSLIASFSFVISPSNNFTNIRNKHLFTENKDSSTCIENKLLRSF